ncbi:MAG: hypothetical protein ACOWWR_17445 [Eubacteriales bacterium]
MVKKIIVIAGVVAIMVLVAKSVLKEEPFDSKEKFENYILSCKSQLVDSIEIDKRIISDSILISEFVGSLNQAQEIDLYGVRKAVNKRLYLKMFEGEKTTPYFEIIITKNYGPIIVIYGPARFLGFKRLYGYYESEGIDEFLESLPLPE